MTAGHPLLFNFKTMCIHVLQESLACSDSSTSHSSNYGCRVLKLLAGPFRILHDESKPVTVSWKTLPATDLGRGLLTLRMRRAMALEEANGLGFNLGAAVLFY